MAKIQEQQLTITISKLVKDTELDEKPLLPDSDIESLEAVIRELSDPSVLIEIENTKK